MAKGKGRKHHPRKRRGGGNTTILRSKILIDVAAPSTIPANIVFTSFQLDTDFCTEIQNLANYFQFWRFKAVNFKYIPIVGTQNIGTIAACVLEDPGSTVTNPLNLETIITARCSTMGSIKEHHKIHYKPKGQLKWFYCQDTGIIETADRLEMPGRFCYATTDTTAATVPGRWLVEFTVEFKDHANPNLQMVDPKQIQTYRGLFVEEIQQQLEKQGIKLNLQENKATQMKTKTYTVEKQEPPSTVSSPSVSVNQNYRIIGKMP